MQPNEIWKDIQGYEGRLKNETIFFIINDMFYFLYINANI